MKEQWKLLENYPNYEVSNLGQVRNKVTGYILNPWIINSGYKQVSVFSDKGKKNELVHRLVAETFLNNSKNLPVVNHLDNNRLNNRVDNLEWVTYKDNTAYSSNQGRLNTSIARTELNKVSSKEVYQKDKKGKIVKTWESISQAFIESNGYYSKSKISEVANGSRKYHRGFSWEFVNKKSNRSKSMSINMYDLDGNLLFSNLTMNKIMGILDMNNHKTLRDKLRNTTKGVKIKYKGYQFSIEKN